MHALGDDLLSAFSKLFYLQFCVASDQLKSAVKEGCCQQLVRYFYMDSTKG